MSIVRKVTGLLAAILGVTLSAAPASAKTPIDCSEALADYFDPTYPAGWLSVIGTRVSARNGFGFAAFTMNDGFQIEATPLHTSAAAESSTFFTWPSGSTAFTGYFHEVFLDRGNGDEDRSQFWIYDTGSIYIRSVTWNGSWRMLQNQVCYAGPQGQVLVTGQFSSAGDLTLWTFVMQGGWLI